MADKSIEQLNEANSVGVTDLFVLQQQSQAKKLSGNTLKNWLLELADGHGGISSITGPETEGLEDTYTINYADDTTSTFVVTNGKAIASIATYFARSTSGSTAPSTGYTTTVPTITSTYKYLWTYQTITFNDGSTVSTTKHVNGVYGDTGLQTYVYIKWSSVASPSSSQMSDSPDNYIGIGVGTSASAPSTPSSYQWFKYKGEKGDTGNAITSVQKTGTSGLVDTYQINFTSGNPVQFTVTNGSKISSISKTGTQQLVDTYQISMTDGTSSYFTVTNGKGITSIDRTSGTGAPGTTDTYTITYNDDDTQTFNVYNGANGTGAVSSVDGVEVSSSAGDVPLLLVGNSAPTQSTIGQYKQRYFNYNTGILYICMTEDASEGLYDWRGTGVIVDSAFSTTSTNPVQNKVIANKINSLIGISGETLLLAAQ